MSDYIEGQLKPNEQIVLKASSSKRALIVVWLFFPTLLVLYLAFTVAPPLFALMRKGERTMELLNAAGVTDANFSDQLKAVLNDSLGVFKPLFIFGCVMLGLLAFVWLCWVLVMTKRHFGYELALTDSRVIGRAKGESIAVPYEKVKNVMGTRNWLGKLLNYGTLTILTAYGAVDFKSISKPEEIKRAIFARIQNFT